MSNGEPRIDGESRVDRLSLSEIIHKLRDYTEEVYDVLTLLDEKKYAEAEQKLGDLVNTPALFDSLPEGIRKRYKGHDLFQDFYHKVASFSDAMHWSLEEFREGRNNHLERDIESFQRIKKIWPFYKLIMDAFVVRAYNIQNGKSDDYIVPEFIEDIPVQEDIDVDDFSQKVRQFVKDYPKLVYLDDANISFDPTLKGQKIHVSEGVLFNIVRDIIGNVIAPEKHETTRGHNFLLRFSLFPSDTGVLYFQIEILDDGVGIPPQLLPHIFKEGVSGTESTGLGLAHVDEFV